MPLITKKVYDNMHSYGIDFDGIAKEANIDPDSLKAIMLKESTGGLDKRVIWDPNKVDINTAYGPFQITKDTFRLYADKGADPSDLNQQAKASARKYAEAYRRYANRSDLGYVGYNAGFGKLDSALKKTNSKADTYKIKSQELKDNVSKLDKYYSELKAMQAKNQYEQQANRFISPQR